LIRKKEQQEKTYNTGTKQVGSGKEEVTDRRIPEEEKHRGRNEKEVTLEKKRDPRWRGGNGR